MRNIINRSLRFLILLAVPAFLISCEKLESGTETSLIGEALYYDRFDAPGMEPDLQAGIDHAREKAFQIGNFEWIAKGHIPSHTLTFNEGTTVKGSPYSSVRLTGGFLGYNVSFFTFMSAINNPRSRIYTVDLSDKHYHTSNASTYYGTVCSAAVAYALGLKFPYHASQIIKLPFVKKLPVQCSDSLQVCDIFHRSGHVVMVFDLERDNDGHVTTVRILESSGGTGIRTYSVADFENRCAEQNLVAYRYDKERLSVNACPEERYCMPDGNNVEYVFNEVLCPDRGERSSYYMGETVTFNLLSEHVKYVNVERDGASIGTLYTTGEDVSFVPDKPGKYEAYTVMAGDNKSEPVEFEVLDYEFHYKRNQNVLTVSWGDTYAEPKTVFISGYNGDFRAIHNLTDEDREAKTITMSIVSSTKDNYLRMEMAGEYGTIYTPLNNKIK